MLILVVVFVVGWLAGIATANAARDRRIQREGVAWLEGKRLRGVE